jgi:hypothetical protein
VFVTNGGCNNVQRVLRHNPFGLLKTPKHSLS